MLITWTDVWICVRAGVRLHQFRTSTTALVSLLSVVTTRETADVYAAFYVSFYG